MQLLSNIKSYFENIYLRKLDYASGREFTEDYLKRANPGTTFLDAGCGQGNIRDLLPEDVRYIGIDFFEGDNCEGYQGWQHRPDIVADLHCLPLRDSSCDTLVLLHVLEHLHSPQKAISELARVMKPGARLYIAVPFLHQLHHQPNDYYRFARYSLEHLFKSVGLTTVSIRPTGGYFRSLAHILGRFIPLYKSKKWFIQLLLFPLVMWILFLRWTISSFEYPLDLLDNKQELTCGYLCIASKTIANNVNA